MTNLLPSWQDAFLLFPWPFLFILIINGLIWFFIRKIVKQIANYTEAKGLQNETLEEIRDLLIEIKEERANKR